VVGGEGVLGEDAEESLELRKIGKQSVDFGFPDTKQLAVLEGVDGKDAGALVDHTPDIADPPPRRRELYHVFEAVAVDRIAAEKAGHYKGGSLYDLAFLVEELFLFDDPVMEQPDKMLRFLARKGNMTGDMLEKERGIHG